MAINSKGAALAMVLVMIMLVTALASSGLKMTASNFEIGTRDADAVKAFYFAEAGIQRALFKIKNTADPNQIPQSPSTWSFDGQNISLGITATTDPNVFQVLSTCTYGQSNTTKSITATIQKQNLLATLSAWGS